MSWAHPELLSLLLLVPVVLVGAVLAWRRRSAALARIAAVEALRALIPPRAGRARAVQAVASVVAVAGMALAAAGPQLGFEWEQRRMEGVSIVVVLDVSRSMDAQDVSPSRLEAARRELEDFTGLLKGDTVGLVLFAEGAWVRIPLTTDYSTFLWSVKDSSSDTIQAQGTALSGALDAATKMLARAPGTGKAVLVVSDGESHEKPEELQAATSRAAAAGVRIYALGVGEASGAPIPLAEGGFKKDEGGNVVLSKLDEATLSGLAAATGGAYVHAVASDEDVRGIYEGEIRGKLEAAERGVRREKRPEERYQWPLGAAALVMAVSAGAGIGPRRPGSRGWWRRRTAAAAASVLVGLIVASPARAGARDDGMKAYEAQNWAEAARLLGQARVEDPGDSELGTALGTALYRAGRYRESEQIFESLASSTTDPAEKAIHSFNAGNAAYRGGRLDKALEDFKASETASPAFEPAQKNGAAVAKELAARQQQKQQQDSQDQDGKSGQDGQQGDQSQANQGAGDQGQQQQAQDNGQGQQGQEGQQQGQQGQAAQQQGQPPEGQGGAQQGTPSGGDPGQQGAQAAKDGAQQGASPASPDGKDPAGGVRDPSDPAGGGTDTDAAAAAQAAEGGTDTDPHGEDAAGAVTDGGGEEDGQGMSPTEASRLVDSVPDGKPRVAINGRSSGKDW